MPTINLKKVCTICIIGIVFLGILVIFRREKYFISITVTHETEKKGVYESDVIIYDIHSGKSKLIESLPYTSQYPLTIYDKKADLIYFTANDSDNHGDEIFCFNCKTKNTEQLTDDFFAINYIYPSERGLFIGGVLRGEHTAVHPFFYNFRDKELENLTWDEDFFINSMNANKDNSIIYFSGFSEKEEQECLDEEIDGIDNGVYKCVDNKMDLLFTTKKNYVETLAVNEEYLIYRCGDRTFDPIQKICIMDLKNDIEYDLDISEEQISEMGDFIGIIDKKLFFIVNYSNEENCSCIWSMDLDTKKSKCIFKSENNSRINNAQIIYGRFFQK